jgi:UDP-N-acetylglucosamine transferase subunit ALG13
VIFVTVGTQRCAFDRLVVAADGIANGHEPVIVQSGTSRAHLNHATSFDFLPFADIQEYMRSARVVVTHAGIGSVALSLRLGHRPVVVPRLAALDETIDGHQLSFALRLAQLDLITLVRDAAELAAAVRTVPTASPPTGHSPALVDELIDYISRYATREHATTNSTAR